MTTLRSSFEEVAVASADAMAAFESFDFDASLKVATERRITSAREQATYRINGTLDPDQRDAFVLEAVDLIESIVVACFLGHLRGLSARIEDILNLKEPPKSMSETLSMVLLRIQNIETQALQMSRSSSSVSERLNSAFSADCRLLKSTVVTCEDALRSMRSWTGTRRDWAVTGVVTLVVSILLIPIVVIATSWWEAVGRPSGTATNPAAVGQQLHASTTRQTGAGDRLVADK